MTSYTSDPRPRSSSTPVKPVVKTSVRIELPANFTVDQLSQFVQVAPPSALVKVHTRMAGNQRDEYVDGYTFTAEVTL